MAAESIEELTAQLEAVAAESFGAAIGQLIRAVDEWEKCGGHAVPMPPKWALEARDRCIQHMEFLAEQQGNAPL